MSRSIAPLTLAEFKAAHLYPAIFFEGEFATGTVYLWSGIGSIVWDGKTWLGVGTFGEISGLTETTDLRAENVSFSLSGIPNDLVTTALNECRPNKQVKVYIGALDQNGAIVLSPYLGWSGKMDVPTLDEGTETSKITITAESRLVALQRAKERRYTPEDQKLEYPNDKGFDFVPKIQQMNLTWGPGAVPYSGPRPYYTPGKRPQSNL